MISVSDPTGLLPTIRCFSYLSRNSFESKCLLNISAYSSKKRILSDSAEFETGGMAEIGLPLSCMSSLDSQIGSSNSPLLLIPSSTCSKLQSFEMWSGQIGISLLSVLSLASPCSELSSFELFVDPALPSVFLSGSFWSWVSACVCCNSWNICWNS